MSERINKTTAAIEMLVLKSECFAKSIYGELFKHVERTGVPVQ